MTDFDNDYARFMGAIFLAVFVSIAIIAGTVIHAESVHKRDLEEHGCQVYSKSETGHTRMSGKVSHPEVLTIYECKDGMRYEYE